MSHGLIYTVSYLLMQNAGEESVANIDALLNSTGQTSTAELRLKMQKVSDRIARLTLMVICRGYLVVLCEGFWLCCRLCRSMLLYSVRVLTCKRVAPKWALSTTRWWTISRFVENRTSTKWTQMNSACLAKTSWVEISQYLNYIHLTLWVQIYKLILFSEIIFYRYHSVI